MIVEVEDEKAGLASQMFGKTINILHEPEVGWIIYNGKVVGLSMEYPGEAVD